jgi:hypothetical protein
MSSITSSPFSDLNLGDVKALSKQSSGILYAETHSDMPIKVFGTERHFNTWETRKSVSNIIEKKLDHMASQVFKNADAVIKPVPGKKIKLIEFTMPINKRIDKKKKSKSVDKIMHQKLLKSEKQ